MLGAVSAQFRTVALRALSLQDTLVEGNVIGLADPNLIQYVASENVNAFGNQFPNGSPIPLFEDTVGGGTGPFRKNDSLEDKVQDALLFALL